jgi:MFS family permease
MRASRVLAALRSRDYRLFWSGSLVSNIGLWMQQIALGWWIYDHTRSASMLGMIGFCANAPFLVLGLVGGAIADRASRRTVMLGTQLVLAAAATTLALLTAGGLLSIWQVILLAVIAGTANAIYAPTMQAVIPALVEPDVLLNAVSLNAVQFNLARALGPAAAALAYAAIGAAGCFSLNAASFLVLALLLARVRLPERPAETPPPMAHALRAGLGYARAHPVIGPALVLAALLSFCGFPYIILLPALARDALHLESATGLGYLMAAVGAGAVTGGLALSAAGDVERKGLLAAVSALGFGLVLGSVVVVRSAWVTAALLYVLGVLQTGCAATLNVTIQVAVDDRMRGRVMSMLTVILFGLSTAGGLVVGALGDRIGVPAALAAGGAVIAVAACAFLLRVPGLVGIGRRVPQDSF